MVRVCVKGRRRPVGGRKAAVKVFIRVWGLELRFQGFRAQVLGGCRVCGTRRNFDHPKGDETKGQRRRDQSRFGQSVA